MRLAVAREHEARAAGIVACVRGRRRHDANLQYVVGGHVAAGDEQLHVDLALDALGPRTVLRLHRRVETALLALEERLLAELIVGVLRGKDRALALGAECELAGLAQLGKNRVERRKLRTLRKAVVGGFKVGDKVAVDLGLKSGMT